MILASTQSSFGTPSRSVVIKNLVVLPEVSSVGPLSAVLNRATTFTISGRNLPTGMGFWIADCAGVRELSGGTTSRRQFSCTPGSQTGLKDGVVKDRPGGRELYRVTVTLR